MLRGRQKCLYKICLDLRGPVWDPNAASAPKVPVLNLPGFTRPRLGPECFEVAKSACTKSAWIYAAPCGTRRVLMLQAPHRDVLHAAANCRHSICRPDIARTASRRQAVLRHGDVRPGGWSDSCCAWFRVVYSFSRERVLPWLCWPRPSS